MGNVSRILLRISKLQERPQTGEIYLGASSFLAKLVKGITVKIYIRLKWFQTNLQ